MTEESIVRNFVGRVLVEEPLAYVRQASHEQTFLCRFSIICTLQAKAAKAQLPT